MKEIEIKIKLIKYLFPLYKNFETFARVSTQLYEWLEATGEVEKTKNEPTKSDNKTTR